MAYGTRELVAMLEADGWRMVRQKGSHQQWKHPTKPGRITIVAADRNQHPKTVKQVLIATGSRPE